MDDLSDDERDKLREMIKTWDDASAGVRVVVAIGNIVKWTAAVAAAVGILWALLHDKRW